MSPILAFRVGSRLHGVEQRPSFVSLAVAHPPTYQIDSGPTFVRLGPMLAGKKDVADLLAQIRKDCDAIEREAAEHFK